MSFKWSIAITVLVDPLMELYLKTNISNLVITIAVSDRRRKHN